MKRWLTAGIWMATGALVTAIALSTIVPSSTAQSGSERGGSAAVRRPRLEASPTPPAARDRGRKTAPSRAVAASRPGADPGIEQLVAIYEGMRPKEAASVMAQLDPVLAIRILLAMRERQAARVLGLLPPQQAADLTARIAQARQAAPPPEEAGRGARGNLP